MQRIMTALFIWFFAFSFLPREAVSYDPLHLNVRTVFPAEIKTVGAAANYLVDGIGYRLKTNYPAPQESARIAIEPLSPLARSNKVMTIEDALLLVIGDDSRLVVDHVHKLISFETYDREGGL